MTKKTKSKDDKVANSLDSFFFSNIINIFMTEVPSNRNNWIDLLSKSIDWFVYDRDLRHQRIFFIGCCWYTSSQISAALKVYVLGVFLLHIFPHSYWIQGDAEYLFVFSPNAENYGPENSKYGHFWRSAYLN